MIDYYCKPPSSFANTNDLVVQSQSINCTTTNERPAIDQDGDNPYVKVQCIYYTQSVCENNHCVVGDLSKTPQEGVVWDSSLGKQGKYIFREYITADKYGSSTIKESCVPVDHDLDSSQQLCEQGSIYGIFWKNGECCGDDYNDEPSTCQGP
jgi:hypothetical protein